MNKALYKVQFAAIFILFLGSSAWGQICQPGKWPYPVYMGTNVGPDKITSGGCNYGTSTFEATDGSWITPGHVANIDGQLSQPLLETMLNPGLGAWPAQGYACTYRNPPLNPIGEVPEIDGLLGGGAVNSDDAAKVANGDVQPEILELGIPSEFVPNAWPKLFPVAYYGATSCLVVGYVVNPPRTVVVAGYKFASIMEMDMAYPKEGDSGACVISASDACHMCFGMLEARTPSDMTLSNGFTGYPTWVMPLNPVLESFNIGIAGGNA